MKPAKMRLLLSGSIGLILSAFAVALFMQGQPEPASRLSGLEKVGFPKVRSAFSPKNKKDDAQARAEYELARLRDPQTGTIPRNIRAEELAFAEKLPRREELLAKGSADFYAANWVFRGPNNVGGRTRALAIDRNFNGSSNRRVLAGGVSGGMFLSEDDGQSWRLVSSLTANPAVTCVAQDPNNPNVWYFGTGELIGSSNFVAGQGLFKSTDNGTTWNQLPSTANNDPILFDNTFDVVNNIAIHPQTSAVFVAIFGQILRSSDGGNSWGAVRTARDSQGRFGNRTDVAIAANGDVYATLSRNGTSLSADEYGVFRSTDGGVNFTNITPPELGADPYRMVLGTAPSDANTLYMLAQTLAAGAVASDHQLFRYDVANNQWTNLSANLPNEQGVEGNASFSSQGGYDLLVAVKPDNANTIWIGGTNLYRSTNGGQSFTRVGGYAGPSNYALYANHHPDLHSMAFYPNNPNAAISGHDGGLSKAANVLQQPQTWQSLNNGYTTSQFYAIAADPQAGGTLLLGGMQDNGTFGTESSTATTPWDNFFSGDGGYAAVAPGGLPFYVSAQLGQVFRANVQNNTLIGSNVAPQGASNFLFIAPYVLDPNDARVMYIAADNSVWRNSNLDAIPLGNQNPTSINWTRLSNSAVQGTSVTTLAISRSPANRLYFGAVAQGQTVIKRLDNPAANPAGTVITPPGTSAGSYPSSIAIHPNNADEVIVTFSNYRVPSIFYSNDGGATWSDIEGNLAGNSGPSIRYAQFVPGTGVFIGTSVGVYAATSLNGTNTNWVQEGAQVIGNVPVEMLVYRGSDGLLAAGSHGRGVFSATVTGGGAAQAQLDRQQVQITIPADQIGTAILTLSNIGGATLNYTATPVQPAQALPKNAIHLQQVAPGTGKVYPFAAVAARPSSLLQLAKAQIPTTTAPRTNQNDVLALDDGNDTPDDFVGTNDGNGFTWMNSFTLQGIGYQLESMMFYMRTENSVLNQFYVAVLDGDGNTLAEGNINLALSPAGRWFMVNLNSPISFNDGQTFGLLVQAPGAIGFPAGFDYNASVPNNSYFIDTDTGEFVSIAGVQGFENGAFLIRAVGTITTGGFDRLTVSPTSGAIAAGSSVPLSISYNAQGAATGTYQGSVQINTNGGNFNVPVQIEVTPAVSVDEPREVPASFALQQNYPNPFNPETTIRYALPVAAQVKLVIFDSQGREVRVLAQGQQTAGEHRVIWNGTSAVGERLASGLYFYRLEMVGNDGSRMTELRKMTLLK